MRYKITDDIYSHLVMETSEPSKSEKRRTAQSHPLGSGADTSSTCIVVELAMLATALSLPGSRGCGQEQAKKRTETKSLLPSIPRASVLAYYLHSNELDYQLH